MNPLSSLRSYLELDVTPDLDGEAATRRSNRRRLRVFLLVFALVLIPGLLWNFLRPAEYMATARVQPAEAPRILCGKQLMKKPLAGSASRLCSFSRWQ